MTLVAMATTGRWGTSGPELFRLQDRKGSDYCLGPTHEEVVTELVAAELSTYRQLPLRLYQMDRKFRDEVRYVGTDPYFHTLLWIGDGCVAT